MIRSQSFGLRDFCSCGFGGQELDQTLTRRWVRTAMSRAREELGVFIGQGDSFQGLWTSPSAMSKLAWACLQDPNVRGTSPPVSVFSDIVLVARSWSWWPYLQYGKWQTPLRAPAARLLRTRHWFPSQHPIALFNWFNGMSD